MCFSVQIKVDLQDLADRYHAQLSRKFKSNQFISTPSGFMKTDTLPVLFSHEGEKRIEPMNWSLSPSWAKEYPPKWSTYNARMERVYKGRKQKIFEVPTFKNAFKKNKFCLVPINAAIEACYWGKASGNIINFHKKDYSSFLVAGLYDSWINPFNGEVKNTCTLITDGPYPFLFEHGHDRSIIVLDKNIHDEFLQNKNRSKEESFELIKKGRVDLDWNYEIVRKISEAAIKKNTPTKSELNQIKQTIWKKA